MFKDKISSVSKWTDAVTVYVSVYSVAHPYSSIYA